MADPDPYAFAAPARLDMLCECCKGLADFDVDGRRFCFACFGETYLRTVEAMGEDVSYFRAEQAEDPVALGMAVAWRYAEGGYGHELARAVAEERPS
jgi:hypothetical protein